MSCYSVTRRTSQQLSKLSKVRWLCAWRVPASLGNGGMGVLSKDILINMFPVENLQILLIASLRRVMPATTLHCGTTVILDNSHP